MARSSAQQVSTRASSSSNPESSAHAQHLLGELAVVAQHAVERLQAHVAAVQLVQHAHRVHVVVEVAPGARMVALAQEAFARMAERRVPHVVPERDGLDELAVQPQKRADAARDAAHQLHVQAAPADVVVLHEREHLRLVGVAVVGRHVEDLLDVAREGGARERGLVVGVRLAARHLRVVEGAGVLPAGRAVGTDGLFHARVEREVGYRFGHAGSFRRQARPCSAFHCTNPLGDRNPSSGRSAKRTPGVAEAARGRREAVGGVAAGRPATIRRCGSPLRQPVVTARCCTPA